MNSSFSPHPPARGKLGVGKSDSRAFTILEVMIATFVMSLVIGTSLIALQTGFKYIDVARGDTLASQIMQSEIERLRLMAWSKTAPTGVVDSITELPASETVDLSTMFSTNVAALSSQERRVLALVAEGLTNKEVGEKLGLSDNTVKNYLVTVFEKLQVKRRSQAAALFVQQSKPPNH